MTQHLSLEHQRNSYVELAVAWDEAQTNADAANTILRQHHEIAKLMRSTAAGRHAIEELFNDPRVAVQIAAATDSLWWDSAEGVGSLERIEAEGGRYSFDAKWTLRSYRTGTLDLDW